MSINNDRLVVRKSRKNIKSNISLDMESADTENMKKEENK